ncbi:hypothetical protein FA13DRAFT_1689796 [Coprinellus micaceus]|uniref:Snurportin-1 n=1 Tax=Coprinellus micaceus TaxID=71717 RepID=A0A4Y7T6K0_COPMI|nr:hypothetical protein FA13DRAFT_1689796 [Coprinellus micaceus]
MRMQALEEQKRRRAQQIESNRQFDLFAHLSINDDSDSDDLPEEDGGSDPHTPASAALGPYVSMLNEVEAPAAPSSEMAVEYVLPVSEVPIQAPASPITRKKKPKKKNKKKGNYNKPSKWADQCMYAELLEMATDDPAWSTDDGLNEGADGLPKDLESGWVAIAPVPVGKRCLVVTHQTAGVTGTAANTTIRSRLLGKSLIPRFPSPLPPLTVLDCILDANWRDNGIIHVLDVVRWKGQDIGDCEAPFRFWWRDTRLGELPQALPPTINFFPKTPKSEASGDSDQPPRNPQFPYPTYFLPIPYHTNTSLDSLDAVIVPSARSQRSITVEIPVPKDPSLSTAIDLGGLNMDFRAGVPSPATFTFTSMIAPSIKMTPAPITIQPDGLLLYTAEASYEPGTSPLSSWVPITGYDPPGAMEVQAHQRPLDLFHRLVQRRLQRRLLACARAPNDADASMDVESGA